MVPAGHRREGTAHQVMVGLSVPRHPSFSLKEESRLGWFCLNQDLILALNMSPVPTLELTLGGPRIVLFISLLTLCYIVLELASCLLSGDLGYLRACPQLRHPPSDPPLLPP